MGSAFPEFILMVNSTHQPCSGLGRSRGSCDAVRSGACIGADQAYPQGKVHGDCNCQELPVEPDPPVRHTFCNSIYHIFQQKKGLLLNQHNWYW